MNVCDCLVHKMVLTLCCLIDSVAACGTFGDDCPPGNNNGTLSVGGGSGSAYPNNLITPLAGIQYRALQDGNIRVISSLNNSNLDSISETAAGAETSIVFASAWAAEGYDRDVRLICSCSGICP